MDSRPFSTHGGQQDDSRELRLARELTDDLTSLLDVDGSGLDADTPFAELGMDSMIAVQWVRTLSARHAVSLATTALFDHPTIRRMTRFLLETVAREHGDLLPPAAAQTERTGRPGAETPAVGDDAIAIVGMSGRFPQARTLAEFWRNLLEGRDCVTEIPPERWPIEGFYEPAPAVPGRSYSKWMGALADVDRFDAAFFSIAPAEAQWMDPQQRIFLEECWRCLEDAGLNPASLSGSRCGVFAGCGRVDYALSAGDAANTAHGLMGSSAAILAGRVAYVLNLQGPCLSLNTASSSSLVAIAQACDSLLLKRSDLALAGGVCVLSGPTTHVIASDVGMLSPRGRCFSFDARADGFVPAEGVGVVLLKRLADAVRDGDHVHAVIRGWAVNQDGKTNGITAPSAASQTRLEREVYERFAIDPATITMVEAHGTGTKLGDPIEVQALTEAFRTFTDREQYCALGSLKSNIGHPLAAAGVAGVMKAAFALQHRLIPATIQFAQLNEHISLDRSPFFVNRTPRAWEPDGDGSVPRRAAVSSFGYSGTNAHLVIEEFVDPRPVAAETAFSTEHPAVVVLSARSAEQVTEQARALLEALRARAFTDADLADIAFTLQTGRQAMSARLAIVAGSMAELEDALARVTRAEPLAPNAYRATGADRPARAAGPASTPARRAAVGTADAVAEVAADAAVNTAEEALRSPSPSPSPTLARAAGRLSRADALCVADQWTRGLVIDWQQLHVDRVSPPRRVSLPTYPFAGERYWIEEAPSSPVAEGAETEVAGRGPAPPPHRQPSTAGPSAAHALAAPACDLMTFEERWEAQPLPSDTAASGFAAPRTVVCILSGRERQQAVLESLRATFPEAHAIFIEGGDGFQQIDPAHYAVDATDADSWRRALRAIAADHGPLDAALALDAIDAPRHARDHHALLALLQAVGTADITCPRLLLAGTYASLADRCHLDARIALGRSLRRIVPNTRVTTVIGQAADESRPTPWTSWLSRLRAELRAGSDDGVFFDGDRRLVSRLQAIAEDDADGGVRAGHGAVRIRPGGTYLITGGAGALGSRFARHLATGFAANVILVGRSALDPARRRDLEALAAPGAQVWYVEADVCDEARMRDVAIEAESRCGPIHGVIHAAGASDGRSLLARSLQSTTAVLGPKIAGTLALDAALAGRVADFMCYCSSSAALLGDFGACDYALGNRFQLAFARYAASDAARRAGGPRRLAIAWPIWQDGRIRPDDELRYFEATGQRALATDEAMAFFERALREPHAAPMPIVGDRAPLHRWLGLADSGGDPLMARARLLLKKAIGARIGLRPERIDGEAPLERYGLESVLVLHLTRDLEKTFGPLSPTLFYQYQTLDALTAYFVSSHRDAVRTAVGETSLPAASSAARPASITAVASAASVGRTSTRAASPSLSDAGARDRDIAIIGMAGRYPHARDLDQFWENLEAGRDSITTIPPDRWPLEGFYDADVDAAVARGRSYCKSGGFIDGFTEFDPLFFNIAPRDAVAMDPQERLFLQICWAALEDGGCTRETLASQYRGRVGVFAGITKTGFDLHGPDLWRRGDPLLPRTSFGSVANRVSYLLDLHGPSMPIDTMCSASLTAIHEACEHLLRDECELAIAGGVNLYAHPATFVFLCQRRLLSPDGRCRAFGKGGNGMVPGEGAGVVLLKRLSDAVRDEDRILAVIRGSHINHGGKTNGYTVPNPVAQRDLVRETLRKARVHPRAIGYVEAHGTGTELGDPIEIAGLTQAFEPDTGDRQFCAIGSVKSNIGHLEAAAGIAGLHKIILQMQHGQLVPSLHADELNPNIDFSQTPFAVQRERREWHRPHLALDGVSREYPRVAALSSFGAGGSNAHVIVEEYRGPVRRGDSAVPGLRPPRLIVLSARTADRLAEQVARLADALTRRAFADEDLADIALTLQVGREAMEHRLALLVMTIAELRQKLACLREGDEAIDDLQRGEVTREQHALGSLSADEDVAALVDAWVAKGKYARLLELWVKGLRFDWLRLYGDRKPRLIALPTYPFAREHYWLPVAAPAAARSALTLVNTSDLDTTRFTATFTGEEFFLADHVVRGARVLPAVVYLEMARAALERVDGAGAEDAAITGTTAGADAAADVEPAASAADGRAGAARTRWLTDIVWQQPFIVGATPAELHIELARREDGAIACDILGADGLHAQITAEWRDAPLDGDRIDLAARLRQCDEPAMPGEQLYAAYAALGLAYGPSHRSVRQLYVGHDERGGRFVLAELRLPESIAETASAYGLHPSVLDGALQAALGLRAGGVAGVSAGRPPMPFALDGVECLRPAPASGEVWAYLRAAGDSTVRVPKLDLDLCDGRGLIATRLRGLATRVAESAPIEEEPGTVLMTPVWEEAPAPQAAAPAHRFVHIVSPQAGVEVEADTASGAAMAAHYERCAADLLEETQRLLRERPQGDLLLQVMVPTGRDDAALLGLSGLLKTARMENPRLATQIIGVDSAGAQPAAQETARLSDENAGAPHDSVIRYANGVRLVERLRDLGEVRLTDALVRRRRPCVTSDGVYLLTGGAGRLAVHIACDLAQQAPSVRLVIAGRSPLGAAPRAALDTIEQAGARVTYHRVDVSDRAAVDDLVDAILHRHGRLDGVIHCAGLLRDSFLRDKSREELSAVFAPKVRGVVHLDESTRDLALDFFVACSSLAGALGHIGQSDYAAANAFVDRYMQLRDERVRAGERCGRSLSIDWTLWADGGMRADDATYARMAARGLRPLPTAEGLEALHRALASGHAQVLVASGQPSKVRAALRGESVIAAPARPARVETAEQPHARARDRETEPAVTHEAAALAGGATDDALRTRVVRFVREQLAAGLGLPVDRVEPRATFDQYGIDSILMLRLIAQLEEQVGPLSKTLLFEYHSVDRLVAYFLASHGDRLRALLLDDAATQVPARAGRSLGTATRGAGASALAAMRTRPRVTQPRDTQPMKAAPANARAHNGAAPLDIAIIGVAGRYPQARNLQQFWDNLRAGRDCITEIRGDRWDHARYFDPEKGKAGKTYGRWGGFLDGVDEFDPLFFGVTPRDAELMNPQERLFLQCAYETIEDAGYTREALERYQARGLEGNVGVFAGVMYDEYPFFGIEAQAAGRPFALPGNPASIANRVSYAFNLHGPSLTLNTMCSSSLTALHLACQSLAHGGCELALAGGVNLSIHPNKYLSLARGQFVSSGGRCESFGAGGDGYVPAEGVGAVLLKPLARAVADGDRIHAVIKGSAINHGGKANGYNVPNPVAQANVIAQALREAGAPARAIGYIEAHGTGTSLGDPIEIAGLARAFREQTPDTGFCAIGSAKSNIGHAESAAGIAGLTKVLLQMRHRQLAPSLHVETLNPHIAFEASPFVVQRELAAWPRPTVTIDGETREYPRLAGVSSFGAGGANAHVVIEEYVAPADAAAVASAPRRPAIILLSAKSDEQVRQQAANLLAAIGTNQWTDADLPGIAYTLQTGREAMEHRLALTTRSIAMLRDRLERVVAGETAIPDLSRGDVKRYKELLGSLFAEDGVATRLADWTQEGREAQLLELWVKGMPFDWRELYGDGHPVRVSLPTYPFAPERYWIPAPAAAAVPRAERLLVKRWRPAQASRGSRRPRQAAILATDETYMLATRLAARIPGSSILNVDLPAAADDAVRAPWSRCDAWIDLVGCGTSPLDGGARARESVEWITDLQAWIEQGPRDARPVALGVSRGLESVDESRINLAGASRAGFYRMLESEYRRLQSRHVDVAIETDEPALVQQVLDEIAADDAAIEVAYRGGVRYEAFLQEVDAEVSGTTPAPPLAFAESYAVWVTGGTRGIGLACAQHLVRHHGVRRLWLTGRDTFPPREAWARHRAGADRLALKIRAIEQLETDGAQVVVSSAPLDDIGALRAELTRVTQTLGPIGGLLHCAGLVDTATPALLRKRPDDVARVMAPKVAGLDNVLQCVAGEPLRFAMLFSSVSAIVPALAVGQSDYAAANGYMDYAAAFHAASLPIVSIQWPSWRDVGMGEATSAAYQQAGLLSLATDEALRMLDRVLARPPATVCMPALVSPDLWRPDTLMRAKADERPPARRANVVSSASVASEASTPTVESWVRATFARELKMDPARLEVDTALLDYGVDSVMLVELLRPVGDAIGETLPPSSLFEYPTVASFAQWLASQHRDAVARVLEPTPAPRDATNEAQAAPPPPASATSSPAAALTAQLTASVSTQLHSRPALAEDVAIVGMACRFPGARNLDEYWSLLAEGRSALRPMPLDRRGHDAAEDARTDVPGVCAGWLDEVSRFDPDYFLIPADDARAMDPQALLVLEESLHAWHHAGYTPRELKGSSVGIYLGARSQHRPDAQLLERAANPIVAVGQNYLAANVARFFDLRGPALVIDTACSSALAAASLAMQALRAEEIEMALVGGVSLLLPEMLRLFAQRGLLASEPRFHLFDRRSSGTVLGEGAGIVVLKRLDRARRDGDTIYARIKAIALNNDGRTASPSAPNLQAQRGVMHAALARAGVRPDEVAYVQVNGSGSEVTDLIELKAIEGVYRDGSPDPCELGSMKPNIGHPLCAEGIASLIQVALMLHHAHIVPFLSAEEPMAHVDWARSPFRFTRALKPWTSARRIAAINSFADGGTNAHVIVESGEAETAAASRRQPIVPLPLRRIDLRGAADPGDWMDAGDSLDPGDGVDFWRRPPAVVGQAS